MRKYHVIDTYYVQATLAVLRAAVPDTEFGIEGVSEIFAQSSRHGRNATWRRVALAVDIACARAYAAGSASATRNESLYLPEPVMTSGCETSCPPFKP